MAGAVEWPRGVERAPGGFLRLSQELQRSLLSPSPLAHRYDVEELPFARGKSAEVRRCRPRGSGGSQWPFAAKCLRKRRGGGADGGGGGGGAPSDGGVDARADILHEVALLHALRHSEGVVTLHGVFETHQDMVLLLDLAVGGDLQALLDRGLVPEEAQVRLLLRRTLQALAHLHRLRVAHLDIKPQNILLSGEYPCADVRLCDLGIARYVGDGADVRDMMGTPDYVAPEVLNFEPISLATDMWSVGVLMYVLLTGCSPFGGDSKQETFCNISRCALDFPEELFEDVSEEAKDLMRRLMLKEPSRRLTVEQCLAHSWFSPSLPASLPPPAPSVIVAAPVLVAASPPPLQPPEPPPRVSPVLAPTTVDGKGKGIKGMTSFRRSNFKRNMGSILERVTSCEDLGGLLTPATEPITTSSDTQGAETRPPPADENRSTFSRAAEPKIDDCSISHNATRNATSADSRDEVSAADISDKEMLKLRRAEDTSAASRICFESTKVVAPADSKGSSRRVSVAKFIELKSGDSWTFETKGSSVRTAGEGWRPHSRPLGAQRGADVGAVRAFWQRCASSASIPTASSAFVSPTPTLVADASVSPVPRTITTTTPAIPAAPASSVASTGLRGKEDCVYAFRKCFIVYDAETPSGATGATTAVAAGADAESEASSGYYDNCSSCSSSESVGDASDATAERSKSASCDSLDSCLGGGGRKRVPGPKTSPPPPPPPLPPPPVPGCSLAVTSADGGRVLLREVRSGRCSRIGMQMESVQQRIRRLQEHAGS